MNYAIYTKEKNKLSHTFFNNIGKKIKIEDDGPTVTDESSTVINEEKLRASKGIIFALIFCIPFWLLFMKIALRLF